MPATVSKFAPFLLIFACFPLHVVAQTGKLSQSQIGHLVQVQAPDSLVASQIRSRGVSFTVTKEIVQELAARHAGPQTLAALRAQIRVGTVVIRTAADAELLLDGKSIGRAGPDGSISVNDIDAGNHDLIVRKSGYQDGHSIFSLSNEERKVVDLPLAWAGGYLTISVEPAGVALSVSGPTSLSGPVKDVQCIAGKYAVTASREGFTTITRTFIVAAGEHHVENIRLDSDPAFISKTLSTASQELTAGSFAYAVDSARRVLRIAPDNAAADAILSEAAYRTGDMHTFVDAGVSAVRGGSPVTISLMHLHTFPHLKAHSVELTITGTNVRLASEPPVEGCKIPDSLTYEQITQAYVQRDPGGALVLLIKWLSNPHSHFVGVLHQLEFLAPGSQEVKEPGPSDSLIRFSSTVIQPPANANAQLGAVAELLTNLTRH